MLAGYITATTTDFVRVRISDNKIKLIYHKSYTNSDFPNFESVLSLYLRKTKGEINVACFGVAGPVIGNKVTATNIPWKVDGQAIKNKFSFNKVTIINDLVASSFGLFQLKEDDFFTINKGIKIINGNMGLIAAGTGLGEALIFYDGKKYCPYASEGGHVGFSPGNQLEVELWEYLYGEQEYVEAEDVISLSGLEKIYEFLLTTGQVPKAEWYKKVKDKSSKIIEMALAGEDEIAVKTLDIFIDCYASEAANLALKGITLGGIYLGGLIAPQIITALEKGRFMERFLKRGKMNVLLSKIPISLIIDDKTALLGAASIASDMSKR